MYDFLTAVSESFELVLFDNGQSQFAKEIVNNIIEQSPSKTNYFSYVLTKEHCSTNESHHDVKNLELFTGAGSNREMKDCLIVDNSIFCFQKQITNGIVINKFEDIENDDWLPCLQKYLVEKFGKMKED